MTNLKTMNIKGKEYVQVNERLKAFRSLPEYKGWSLVSEVVELKEDACTVKATIIDDKGVARATGLAREVPAKSPVNRFAFVENCETSAWGRALGNLGIGIDVAICSAEELTIKMSQDVKTPAQKAVETRKANILAKETTLEAYKKAMEKLSGVNDVSELDTNTALGIQSTIESLAHWGFMEEHKALTAELQSKDSIPF